MTLVKSLVKKHAVVTYFVVTFVLSWGGVLLTVGGPAGLSGPMAQDSPLFPLVLLSMVAGPCVTGLLLTAFVDGRRGLRKLRSRSLEWRVAPRWYAVALLAAPAVAATITMTLSPFSSEFLPGIAVADDRIAVLVLALVVGLTAGIFEEVGWTGFAIPRLTRRYGVLVTGLIVGLLWSLWHVPVAIWGMGDRAGTIPLVVFLVVDGLAGLPAFRVLMVRVYDRTGSLFLAMLMHVSITTTVLTLTPRTTGLALLAYGLAFAAAIWLVVAAMTLVSGWQVPRNQVRRRAA